MTNNAEGIESLSIADVLTKELTERQLRNPQYSQGSFARDLGLSPKRLSAILRQQEGVSRRRASELANRLSLNQTETAFFVELAEASHGRSSAARAGAQQRLKAIEPAERTLINDDMFQVIWRWYYLVILEILTLDKNANAKSVAEQLAISEEAVTDAIDLLIEHGFVAKKRHGYLVTKDQTHSGDGPPSKVIRKFHEQMAHRALHSLVHEPMETRKFHHIVFSANRKRLPQLKKKIDDFWRDISRTAKLDKKRDTVCVYGQYMFNAYEQGERK